MKKLFATVSSIAFAFALVGCGGGGAESQDPDAPGVEIPEEPMGDEAGEGDTPEEETEE